MADKQYQDGVDKDVNDPSLDITARLSTSSLPKSKTPHVADPILAKPIGKRSESGGKIQKGFRLATCGTSPSQIAPD